MKRHGTHFKRTVKKENPTVAQKCPTVVMLYCYPCYLVLEGKESKRGIYTI